jgi:hypothetical protein
VNHDELSDVEPSSAGEDDRDDPPTALGSFAHNGYP